MAETEFVLVPKEPTEAMLSEWAYTAGVFSDRRKVWRAILAASPQPPHTEAPAAQDEREARDSLSTIMALNAWRAALVGLCEGPTESHSTPEKAAANVRGRLRRHIAAARAPQAAAAPQPDIRNRTSPEAASHPLVDPTERSDQSVQRAAGGGAA